MRSEPLIIILEDEKPQRLVLRTILKGLGEIKDFSEPLAALEFLREHQADAAIIDIHLPEVTMNGIDLIRQLRVFDQDLGIIIRTGDDSSELANDAIELKAFRRAIKTKITPERLRELTEAAICETRERRRITTDASSTHGLRTEYFKTLGSMEEELSVSDCYKGLLQSLRNQMTALSAVAEALVESAARDGSVFLREQVARNRQLNTRLLSDLNAFLDGPYGEASRASRVQEKASVNSMLDALSKRFAATPFWSAEQKGVIFSRLDQDLYVSISSVRFMTALRHLLEFCLVRSQPKDLVRLMAHCSDDPLSYIASVRENTLVFNRRYLAQGRLCVVFQVCATLAETSLEQIKRSFLEDPADPRIGNLQMLSLAFADEQPAVKIYRSSTGACIFDLFVTIGT